MNQGVSSAAAGGITGEERRVPFKDPTPESFRPLDPVRISAYFSSTSAWRASLRASLSKVTLLR